MTQPIPVSVETTDLESFAAKVKASSLKLGAPDPSLSAELTPNGFQASQAVATGVTDAMSTLARLKLGVSGTAMYFALLTDGAGKLLTNTDEESADAIRAWLKKAADGVPTVPPGGTGNGTKPVPGRLT
jgi:hypothetical protein